MGNNVRIRCVLSDPIKQLFSLAFVAFFSSRRDVYLKITAITKVMAGRMLLMAHAKVGPVNFRPA